MEDLWSPVETQDTKNTSTGLPFIVTRIERTQCSLRGQDKHVEQGWKMGVLGHGSSLYLGGFQHTVFAMGLEGAGKLPVHRDQSPPYSNCIVLSIHFLLSLCARQVSSCQVNKSGKCRAVDNTLSLGEARNQILISK